MQGRAAAVYGLLFVLVALAAGTYVVVADAPEPALQDPEYTAQEGEQFSIEGPDGTERTYTVDGFDTLQGQPTATLVWTDEDARSQEEWEYAAEPGGTTVVYQGTDHYVRNITDRSDAFQLLEAPPEDGNVSLFVDDTGTWVVNEGGSYTPVAEYDGLAREVVSTGDEIEVGEGEDARTVRVEEVGQDTVTVSWNEPAENEVLVRQTNREQLNGRNVTAHITDDGTVQLTTDEEEIDRYIAAHEDRVHFQQRTDGLIAITVLSLTALVLLLGLAFLPRKE